MLHCYNDKWPHVNIRVTQSFRVRVLKWSDDEKEAARQKQEDDVIKEELKCKIPEANDQDIEELIELFKGLVDFSYFTYCLFRSVRCSFIQIFRCNNYL